MWVPLVARTFGKDVVPELAGGATLVVQAFDLGLLIPLGVFTAVTVFRRLPAGYVLAAIVVVKASALGTAIAAMLLVEGFATGVWQWPPIVLFAAIGFVGVGLGRRVIGSVVEPWVRTAAPVGPPATHARPHGAGAR
jgi:hypothetical protein